MSIETVRVFYNQEVEHEWSRMERHPFEFAIHKAYLDRYIKPGDRVLDIGGGPGRYSLYLAEKGCQVTLLDLSEENVRFAKERAKERGLALEGVVGNAVSASETVKGPYDHVLLMGPLYHLIEEKDRRKAVEEALKLLKAGGNLYAAFIQMHSGIIYDGVRDPECIIADSEMGFMEKVIAEESYGGPAFTEAYFIQKKEALQLMSHYPLEQLYFLGSEGGMAPFELRILESSEQAQKKWMELALKTCEQEQLLCLNEHLMYIGRKVEDPEVILETERLILRDFRESDFENVHEYGSDPETTRFVLKKPNTEEDTRHFLEERVIEAHRIPRNKYEFAITLKESGKVIGGMGLTREAPHEGEIGWMLNKRFHHQGYAQEAARAILSFGFERLGLERIYARCDSENKPSWTLMERLGMRMEGELRKRVYNESFTAPWRNERFYSILREEW